MVLARKAISKHMPDLYIEYFMALLKSLDEASLQRIEGIFFICLLYFLSINGALFWTGNIHQLIDIIPQVKCI